MIDLLNYPFFRNALFGLIIINIAAAMIGTYIISRRMVAISGGITHACFGGLGLGYFLGFNPIAMAAIFAVASSLGVQTLSNRYRLREDSAIAVIWAIGMAIGVIFVFLTPGYVPELNSFLFGNILTVSSFDLLMFAIYTILLASFFISFFRKIVAVSFDRDFAKVAGLPVTFITTSMTVLVAVCIVLTIKLVGIMLLMSMLSLPQLIAELFTKRFLSLIILSGIIGIVGSLVGLFLSAYINVPCSAVIVAVYAGMFIIGKIISGWKNR